MLSPADIEVGPPLSPRALKHAAKRLAAVGATCYKPPTTPCFCLNIWVNQDGISHSGAQGVSRACQLGKISDIRRIRSLPRSTRDIALPRRWLSPGISLSSTYAEMVLAMSGRPMRLERNPWNEATDRHAGCWGGHHMPCLGNTLFPRLPCAYAPRPTSLQNIPRSNHSSS